MFGNALTPKECIEAVVRAVQRYLDKDVCQCCALTMVAHDYKMARNTVEDVWVDYQVAQLADVPDA
jgi:hypothetical protein